MIDNRQRVTARLPSVCLYMAFNNFFYVRLNEHFINNAKWLQAYGRKYIKFGEISIYNKGRYELKSLLTDIESSTIEEL